MKTCNLRFDHLSNLLLRLYYIDVWKLQYNNTCIDAYSWNRLAMPQEEQLYTVFLKFDFNIYIIKTHSQKFILDCDVSWIYKHKDKQQL